MYISDEEGRQYAADWFRFHQGKMDLSGMTDAKEVAFYIHNPNMKTVIRDAIERMDINKEFIFTSVPNLLLWQLYEYLIREIPELK